MKRLQALLMAALMLMCLLPAAPAAASADYSWIKVKLSTNNATSLTMYVSGSYFIKENGAEFTGGTITLRSNGDGTVTLSHSSGGELYTASSMSIMRYNVSRDAGYLKLGGRCYLGHFNIKAMSSGYIRVVNEVPLAHYLYGVVGYEMSNTFPIEALKAQAIAAKCYVLSNITMSGDYYIGDTSSDQVYKGYDSSYTNVINAVDSTLDQVLAVNGELLCTYYAASNGGETLLPTQAWPSKKVGDRGYDIRLDPYDLANAYSKKETISIPINMPGSITPALMAMLLSKATGALGYTVNQIDSISDVSLHTPKYKNTTRCMSKCTITLTVSQSGANPAEVSLTFSTSEFESYGVVRDSTLRIYWGEMGSNGYYNIYHVRYGHGVGMSQRGAQAMASEGKSYKDILEFYYPGASFASINVSEPSNPANSAVNKAPEGDYVLAVTTGNVRMRSGPGTGYGSLGTVPSGSEIYVFSSEGGWANASYNGVTGYISEKYVDYPNGKPEPQPTPTPGPSAEPQLPEKEGVIAYGMVNGQGVNFRTGPGTSYASIARLDKNTVLYITDSTNGWYACETESGMKGYMIATYVSITGYPSNDAENEQEVETPPEEEPEEPEEEQLVQPTVVAYGRVTGQGVNFRTGPATTSESMGKLDRNTPLDIYGTAGSWYYGKANNLIGYISGGYVEITGIPEIALPNTDVSPEPEGTPDVSADPNASPTPGVTPGADVSPTPEASPAPEDSPGADPSPTAEPTPTPKPKETVTVGRITASGVNMRIGPGTSYISLKKLSKDTGVYILGKSGSWYSVLVGSMGGYVHEDYVEVTGSVVKDEVETSGATGKGVTTGSVRLRSGPGTNNDIITTLSKGTEITLYGITSGWYSARLADGTAGYVSSKYVKVTQAYSTEESAGEEETQQSTGKGVLTTNVNFRQSPSTSARKFTTLKKGTEVTLYSLKDGWYEAEYNGTRGYLFAKYISVSSVGGGNNVGGGDTGNTGGGTVSTGGKVTLTQGTSTANVNFRSGPSTSGTTIYGKITEGDTVDIIGQAGTWYYVVYQGRVGFVSGDYINITATGTVGIQPVNSSIKAQACVTNSNVNLRTGPSTGYDKITQLSKGTSVTVYYVADGWCFAKCASGYGFLFDEYVSLA
ncbi:MAG: SH3 domain-containing protein [Clostridia bacterium]|nr:SH3 domain-containing protein [Clostridia bacterium]